MVDKIDMSLDDIIKSTKKPGRGVPQRRNKNNTRPGPKGGSGRGATTPGVRRRGQGAPPSSSSPGVLKGRQRGGIGKFRDQRGDVNQAWKHDMFSDFGINKLQIRRGGGGGVGGGAGGDGGSEPTKLLVSNLDFGVSESDMRELFSEFGILKSAYVHYDRSGRSLGTADIVFERRSDAIKAMKQYNGVPLDGRAMNIQLATSNIDSLRPGARLGIPKKQFGGERNGRGPRPGGPNRGNRGSNPRQGGGGGGRKGGPGGGPRRQKATAPTAEQLDAELDAYAKEFKQ